MNEKVFLSPNIALKLEFSLLTSFETVFKPKSSRETCQSPKIVKYMNEPEHESSIFLQFYSADCRAVFQRDVKVSITRANEQEALCLDSHLDDDSPTRIAFSTLADRPSAEDFENSPVLQDWVTATDIRIVFPAFTTTTTTSASANDKDAKSVKEVKKEPVQRPTLDVIRSKKLISPQAQSVSVSMTSDPKEFTGIQLTDTDSEGDEDEDDEVKQAVVSVSDDRQWVGVSDLAIGGRCKCNGHASECSLDRTTG